LVQATSLLFYITDFNGRSLALNLSIPARADPDRGFQVSYQCCKIVTHGMKWIALRHRL
jgi:hypothetical protein